MARIRQDAARAIAAARAAQSQYAPSRSRANEPGPGSLRATLALDRSAYEIGAPIIATLTLRNVSSGTLILSTGADYRGGRPERFRFTVTDARGVQLPDPLAIMMQYGLGGGLGGGETLQPGETCRHQVLLNLFAHPRLPGRYTVQGSYGFLEDYESSASQRLAWPPVAFELLTRLTGQTVEQCEKTFEASDDLKGIHGCILYGLRGDMQQIPALLEYIRNKRAAQSSDSMAMHNRAAYARMALALLPGNEAVYNALNRELVKAAADKNNGEYLADLKMIYGCVGLPKDVGVLERFLDAPEEIVRREALCAALRLGSARAVKRLPGALRDKDLDFSAKVQEAAGIYLNWCQGALVSLRPVGLSTAQASRVEAALLDGLRREERDYPGPEPEICLVRYLFSLSEANSRISEALDITTKGSPIKQLAALRFLLTSCSLRNQTGPFQLDPATLERYRPFVRDQFLKTQDVRSRVLALQCLADYDDRALLPQIRATLNDKEPRVRLAAASTLLIFNDPPSLDRSLDLLTRDEQPESRSEIDRIIRKLNFPNTPALLAPPAGPAGPAAQAYRKEVLRQLLQARGVLPASQ